MNPLIKLQEHGQSFWYDNIRRVFLEDGTIKRMIDDDGLRGMTSNPSIFEKAVGQGEDYDEQIKQCVSEGLGLLEVYEAIVVEDIRSACDLFKGVYEESKGVDGYVSLEVSPDLAHDQETTISEAKRLSTAVDRPNLMIKVPATPAGIVAVEHLIADGININVTLMFNMAHYRGVANAYINGLSKLARNGGDPSQVASVASFFVSRVDTDVDQILSAIGSEEAAELLGKTAVANSKIVYAKYKEIFQGKRFDPLRSQGAKVQRLLWASTSTKNPEYPDTIYVDELIGPDTVNTMPPDTIDAFRDHGKVENTLEKRLEDSEDVMRRITDLGINLMEVTELLQEKGVAAFAVSYNQLLSAILAKMTDAASEQS